MPIDLHDFALGLWSANDAGFNFLNHSLTPANFRGAPLVAVLRGQGTVFNPLNFANMAALYNFAATFDGGLIFCDDNFDALGPDASIVLRNAFVVASPMFTSNLAWTPQVASNTSSTSTVLAGPFIGCGDSADPFHDSVVLAWQLASTYSRTTQRQPWYVGMQGVSTFTEWDCAPPVLGFKSTEPSADAAANRANYFKQLTYVCQGSATTTTLDEQRVAAATLLRPSLARHINPVLSSFLLLADPSA